MTLGDFTEQADAYKRSRPGYPEQLLDELIEHEPQTLFEICNRLIMKHGLASSRQAISQHLEILEEAGLVHTKRQGRYKLHFLDTRPLESIAERWPIKE
jgi:DNA-binding transcriptional ArsR family regulator